MNKNINFNFPKMSEVQSKELTTIFGFIFVLSESRNPLIWLTQFADGTKAKKKRLIKAFVIPG
ncbi:MAG: hypothetical protein WCP61_09065 [Chitinophagia bacterium]